MPKVKIKMKTINHTVELFLSKDGACILIVPGFRQGLESFDDVWQYDKQELSSEYSHIEFSPRHLKIEAVSCKIMNNAFIDHDYWKVLPMSHFFDKRGIFYGNFAVFSQMW